MKLSDIQYHSIRDQARRVLSMMSTDEIESGLTAFESGASSWSQCFFARALPELKLDHGKAEEKLMKHFGLHTIIPIRMIYCTFDGASKLMTKAELRGFIDSILDQRRPPEVLEVLRSINYEGAADREVGLQCQS